MLPKHFYAKVDSLCSAFLWKNKTSSRGSARVAWELVCRPKSEGGLGIRLLTECQLVFQIKQVWNLFANSGIIVDGLGAKNSIWEERFLADANLK